MEKRDNRRRQEQSLDDADAARNALVAVLDKSDYNYCLVRDGGCDDDADDDDNDGDNDEEAAAATVPQTGGAD